MLNLSRHTSAFLTKFKLELVDDVKEWKRWWSMRFIIATAIFSAIATAYVVLPADWLPTISDEVKKWMAYGTLITAGLAGASRVIKQKKPDE